MAKSTFLCTHQVPSTPQMSVEVMVFSHILLWIARIPRFLIFVVTILFSPPIGAEIEGRKFN